MIVPTEVPVVAGTVEVMGGPVDDRTRRFRSHVAIDLGEEAFFPG